MDNKQIIALIKREVVPAIGCTEPAAVALCTAYATEALGLRPTRIDVALSANMLKNAMGVGIPGTGMTGLPIAVALGALVGKSAYSLEVLRDVCPKAVEEAKAWLAGNPVHIGLTSDSDEVLYIDVTCTAGEKRARAVIARDHTRLVYLEGPDGPKVDRRAGLGKEQEEAAESDLTLRRVFEFATTAPLEDIEFINESRRLSCLCGCVVASTGSSCGMTYLMGGGYDQVAASVKNMIANLAGMVCDGAKPSCALKVSSGVSTAVLSAMLAVQNHSVSSVEGLIEDDVDRCIHNLTRLGSVGMQETDKMVLDIMTHKKNSANK